MESIAWIISILTSYSGTVSSELNLTEYVESLKSYPEFDKQGWATKPKIA